MTNNYEIIISLMITTFKTTFIQKTDSVEIKRYEFVSQQNFHLDPA